MFIDSEVWNNESCPESSFPGAKSHIYAIIMKSELNDELSSMYEIPIQHSSLIIISLIINNIIQIMTNVRDM